MQSVEETCRIRLLFKLFYASATDTFLGGIVFGSSVRECVRASVRPCVRACSRRNLLARYLRTHRREFHQTLVDDAVEAKDKPIRFWSRGQGQVATRLDVNNLGPHISGMA